jgi:sigma-E factor negative regulatory protein RseC
MTRVAGTVVEVRDGQAIVECRTAASGCSACGSGHGCTWRRLAPSQRLELPVPPGESGLRAGDRVELSIDDLLLFGAALRLYLPPLAGLLAGPLVTRLAGIDQGLVPLVAASLGLSAGFWVARRWIGRLPVVALERA